MAGLVVVGDSIAKGTGATTETVGYPHLLAAKLGLPLTLLAQGGSGFITTKEWHGIARGRVHQRRARRVPRKRALLLIQSSGNDRQHDTAVIADAMRRFLDSVGDEQAVITGPIWAGTFREQLARVRDAAETVAAERGLPFIAADWWLREGPDGLLAPDGHPNDKGHEDLAARFEAAIRALRPDLAQIRQGRRNG